MKALIYIFIFIFCNFAHNSLANVVLNFKNKTTLKVAFFEHEQKTWLVIENQASSIQKTANNDDIDIYVDKNQNATIVELNKKFPITFSLHQIRINSKQIIKKYTSTSKPTNIYNKNNITYIDTNSKPKIIKIQKQGFHKEFDVIPLVHNTQRVASNVHNTLTKIGETYNGIVITKLVKDIKINITKQGIEIEDSYVDYILQHQQNPLFPIKNWKLHKGSNFYDKQLNIQNKILYTKHIELQLYHRLNFAKLYIAYKMPQEAASYLLEIKKKIEEIKDFKNNELVNQVYALLGLSLFLSERSREAIDIFEKINVKYIKNKKHLQELTFWKESSYEILSTRTAQIPYIENIDKFLQYYPSYYRMILGKIAIKSYLRRNELDKVRITIESLQKDAHTLYEQSILELYRGKLLELSSKSNKKEAIRTYNKIIITNNFFSKPSIMARYNRLMLLYKSSSVSDKYTAKELKKLSTEWRGDDLETNILRSLSNVYIKTKQYQKALNTMKIISLYSSQHFNPIENLSRMIFVFESLFKEKTQLSDIDLVSIFYNFIDLIPIGKEGTIIFETIAKKLENLGLLKETISILNNIIQNLPVNTDKKIQILFKTATLHIKHKEPNMSLEILSKYEPLFKKIPKDLITKMKIDALMQKQKYSEILKIANNIHSIYGFTIRSDVYWRTQDWVKIKKQAESILIYRRNPKTKPSPEETIEIQRLSLAYIALGENQNFIKLKLAYLNMIDDKKTVYLIKMLNKISTNQKMENLSQYIKNIKTIMTLKRKSVVNNEFWKSIVEISKTEK